jgi:regulator of RNase E activity RraB
MKNSNITTATRVRHPEGGDYVIQRQSMNGAGEVLSVAIGKDLHATAVFDGSPDEARKHGFLFGDEGEPGGIPHGTIITHSAYPDRTYGYEWESRTHNGMAVYRIMRDGAAVTVGTVAYMIESGFVLNVPDSDQPSCDVCGALAEDESVDWCGECGNCVTHCQKQDGCEPETWEDKDAVIAELKTRNNAMAVELEARSATISDLREEIQQAKESLSLCQRERSAAHIARGAADRGLESFKSQVRDAIIAAAKEHDLCREGTNSVLSDLGLDEWKATYTVTVTRDEDGETILTVTGIEADSEADAEKEVRDNFRVSATVKRVRYDYEYDGEGETDWDCEDFDDDDLSDDDDCGFADSHMDDLTFSAEEE